MKNYCTLAILLLYCSPNIIMPMRTKQTNWYIMNRILKQQQKAAYKALEYKNAGLIVPDCIVKKLDPELRWSYYHYNVQAKNQQSQSS